MNTFSNSSTIIMKSPNDSDGELQSAMLRGRPGERQRQRVAVRSSSPELLAMSTPPSPSVSVAASDSERRVPFGVENARAPASWEETGGDNSNGATMKPELIDDRDAPLHPPQIASIIDEELDDNKNAKKKPELIEEDGETPMPADYAAVLQEEDVLDINKVAPTTQTPFHSPAGSINRISPTCYSDRNWPKST